MNPPADPATITRLYQRLRQQDGFLADSIAPRITAWQQGTPTALDRLTADLHSALKHAQPAAWEDG